MKVKSPETLDNHVSFIQYNYSASNYLVLQIRNMTCFISHRNHSCSCLVCLNRATFGTSVTKWICFQVKYEDCIFFNRKWSSNILQKRTKWSWKLFMCHSVDSRELLCLKAINVAATVPYITSSILLSYIYEEMFPWLYDCTPFEVKRLFIMDKKCGHMVMKRSIQNSCSGKGWRKITFSSLYFRELFWLCLDIIFSPLCLLSFLCRSLFLVVSRRQTFSSFVLVLL